MKKQYKDLDLKSIRELLDIDFAHYTYQKGMCSCCFGAENLPKKYRTKGLADDEIKTYILFKNADNGCGIVRAKDFVENDNISWELTEEQLDGVCKMLSFQLGENYEIIKPENKNTCIQILYKN